MPSIDIAIPCYQYGRFLPACVDSILSQGFEHTRILIVDNASTDDSAAIARRLAAQDDRIELLLRETNLGPHASFNAGVDWATADYFMVLCADDLLSPGSLGRAVSIMERHPEISFAYGTDVHCKVEDPLPQVDADPDSAQWTIWNGSDFILSRCRNPEAYIAAGMVLMRTSFHKQAGHYRPDLPHTDDFEMLLRLARLGPVAYTTTIQGFKRIQGGNRTNDFLSDRTRDLRERLAAIESFFSREGSTMPDADRLRRLGRRSIAERAYWCGVKDLVRGRQSGFELLKMAFSLNWATALLPPVNYLLRMNRPLGGTPLPHA
jgi:glycosyltransferase involved in cell wall biosynthesis